jgi:hypothetical protein
MGTTPMGNRRLPAARQPWQRALVWIQSSLGNWHPAITASSRVMETAYSDETRGMVNGFLDAGC